MTKDYGGFLRKGGGIVKKAILMMFVLLLAISTVVPQAQAQTAPGVSEEPLPLDKNITIFPKRDMVTVDEAGYFANKNVVVQVKRDGVVIGTARGTADAIGFFEVNHPGGVCWTGSTPNIIAGDVVEVLDDDSEVPDGARAPVRDVSVTEPAAENPNNARQLTMKGVAREANGAPVPIDEIEARIVQPTLVDLIGKRDIRAPGANGEGGTTYTGDFTYNDGDNDPNTWTATYTFTGTNAVAAVDESVLGQSRVLGWKTDPGTAERTGITIYEHGEIDGPGFGGCPAGQNYAVTDAGRKAVNTLNIDNPLTLKGVSNNASKVSVTLDDQELAGQPATAPVTIDNIVPNQASGAQTWTAPAIDAAQVRAFNDGTLTAEATYTIPNPNPGPETIPNPEPQQQVPDPSVPDDGDETTPPATMPDPNYQATIPNPDYKPTVEIGGEKLQLEKDLVVPSAPTATPDAGTYSTAQQVGLHSDEDDATIRYTIGTGTQAAPTSTSPVYSSQIGVTSSQTIKAKTYDKAGNPSLQKDFRYEIVTVTRPGAPTIGNATAGNAEATVRWAAPTNTGGAPIEEYNIRVVRVNADGTSTTIKTVADILGDETSAVVDGLANGTQYKFQVRAFNSAGLVSTYSAFSNTVTPATPVTAPGVPTIGSASAGNASATVRWTPPANNGGAPITEYRVNVAIANPDGTATNVRTVSGVPGDATSAVVDNLQNGTAYKFRVLAVNSAGAGAFSVYSNTVTPVAPVTITAPGAPTIGTAAGGVTTDTAISATARWTAPTNTGGRAITEYRVEVYAANATATTAPLRTVVGIPANATSRQITGLQNGTSYKFKVSASNTPDGQTNVWGARSAFSNTVVAR